MADHQNNGCKIDGFYLKIRLGRYKRIECAGGQDEKMVKQ